MNLEYHINIDKYSWYWIYLPDWERIKHFKRQRICVEKPNHKCDFGPPPKRWWNEENPCQYVSHKIWSSSSFLNIQKYVYQSETKIGFQKKTLVSTLVSFNPRNVLSVFRLILVHGKITHPDSADEVLDLFFKGETPPHVSADGYWNFSVKLEIHPMVLSKKKQTLRNVSPPLWFAINNTSSQCLHQPPPTIFAPLCFDFARAAKAWTFRKKTNATPQSTGIRSTCL